MSPPANSVRHRVPGRTPEPARTKAPGWHVGCKTDSFRPLVSPDWTRTSNPRLAVLNGSCLAPGPALAGRWPHEEVDVVGNDTDDLGSVAVGAELPRSDPASKGP